MTPIEQISSAPVEDEQAAFAGTEDDESDAGLSSLPTVPQHIGSCWDGPVWGPAGDAVRFGSKVPATNRASQKHRWNRQGGKELEPLFQHTTLIDAQWLLDFATGKEMPEKHGVVPPWQHLPEKAIVQVDQLWNCQYVGALPIGVLSYGWASRAHPDPTGEQLQRLVPLLRAIVAFWCDGEHETTSFGIVWDFMSLPQHGYTRGFGDADDRTDEERHRFGQALSNINVWYGHMNTHTFVLDVPLPASASNPTPCKSRLETRCSFRVTSFRVTKLAFDSRTL